MISDVRLKFGDRIRLITPAPPRSLSGNRATAARWMRILRDLGFRVDVSVEYQGEPADAMVALHAWRSASAVESFKRCFPGHPVILALTGTDLYRFINTHPESTLRSMELADHLVALHDLVHRAIPGWAAQKLSVIYQSAEPIGRQTPRKRTFDICVAGHLREEKDPFRAAYAMADIPTESRIRVLHYGKPHEESWAVEARKLMASNPRYHWFGERPHWEVRKAYARARVLVLSSVMEGGANVISEAVMAGLPVIASDIEGSIGLLGERYEGYYPVGDTDDLRNLLLQVENDQALLARLSEHVMGLRDRFSYEREKQGLRSLLLEG